MRPVNVVAFPSGTADTAAVQSSAVHANQLVRCSALAHFLDSTVAGSIAIQASNDKPPADNMAATTFVPTNWATITTATTTFTAGTTSVLIPSTEICYEWIRLVFTPTTPGTSTFSANLFTFGF